MKKPGGALALIAIAEKAKKGAEADKAKASSSEPSDKKKEETGDDIKYALGRRFAEAYAAKDYEGVYEALEQIARRCSHDD